MNRTLWVVSSRVSALCATLAVLAFGLVGGIAVRTAGAGTAVPSAASGSIVFAKRGNIWIAAANGSQQRRVTRNGTTGNPYLSPTQADNGTIVALRDTKIYRLNRNGRVVGRPFKVAVGLRNPGRLHELPERPAVSPDGRKVALFKSLLDGTYDPRTGAKNMTLIAVTTEYRNAVSGRKLGERHEPGTYLQSPSWIDNGRLLVFAPYSAFAPQVFVDTLGGGMEGWFADQLDGDSSFDRKLLDEGELTRSGDRLAAIRGTNVDGDWQNAAIELYSVSSFSVAPTAVCAFPATHGPLAKPTWSPDGTMLAWSDGAGVWSSPVDFGTPGCGLSPRLAIPGGATPDWGPAR